MILSLDSFITYIYLLYIMAIPRWKMHRIEIEIINKILKHQTTPHPNNRWVSSSKQRSTFLLTSHVLTLGPLSTPRFLL